MPFNPLVIVLALCVVGEVVLSVFKQPIPPIIEHTLLVVVGILVRQEDIQPTQIKSTTKTETVTPPIDTEVKQ